MTIEELGGVIGVISLLVGAGYKIHSAQTERVKVLRLEIKADHAKLQAKIDAAFERIGKVELDGAREISNAVSDEELREAKKELLAYIDRIDDRLSAEVQTVREQVIVQLKTFQDAMRNMAFFLRGKK